MTNKMNLSITADQFKEMFKVVDSINPNYNKDSLKMYYIFIKSLI